MDKYRGAVELEGKQTKGEVRSFQEMSGQKQTKDLRKKTTIMI